MGRSTFTANKMGKFHIAIEMWRALWMMSLQVDGGDEEEALHLITYVVQQDTPLLLWLSIYSQYV